MKEIRLNVDLKVLARDERDQLESLLLTYFKEIDTSKIKHVEGIKILDYPYLDSYWEEEGRAAYGVYIGESLNGFALVNSWRLVETFDAKRSIAEFYIRPDYRGKGYGRYIAQELFDKYPSRWEVRQNYNNRVATMFWRSVIDEYTDGRYKEVKVTNREEIQIIQLFDSSLIER